MKGLLPTDIKVEILLLNTIIRTKVLSSTPVLPFLEDKKSEDRDSSAKFSSELNIRLNGH